MNKIFIFLVLSFILLTGPNTVRSENLVFNNTSIKITFVEDDILSKTLNIEFDNLPSGSDYHFRIDYGDTHSPDFNSTIPP